MPIEAIFARSGLLVLPFWILMAALPHWRWTKRIIGSPLISLPAALLYVWLVLHRQRVLLLRDIVDDRGLDAALEARRNEAVEAR